MIEIDDRGRITIPARIRERLAIKPGDKLSISINPSKSIILQKAPTKEQVFNELVGCITNKPDSPPTVESIKGIWKQEP